MKDDSYKRFLESKIYKELLASCSNQNTLDIKHINIPELPTNKKSRRKSLLGFGRKKNLK